MNQVLYIYSQSSDVPAALEQWYEQFDTDISNLTTDTATLTHDADQLNTNSIGVQNSNHNPKSSSSLSSDDSLIFFITHIMGDIFNVKGDQLKILADKMNILSAFRTILGNIEDAFNALSTSAGDVTKEDQSVKDLWQGLEELKTAIQTNKGNLFDSDTQTSLEQSIQSIEDTINPGGKDPSKDETVCRAIVEKIENMWQASPDTTGARELKEIQNEFNTLSTAFNTVSMSTQSDLQAANSNFQQIMGISHQIEESLAKMMTVMVQNQKGG